MKNLPQNKDIVLFDGVCSFCNNSVNFIIDRDSRQQFVFAPLQENTGQSILENFKLSTQNFDAIILYRHGKIYKKSSAALQIARKLDGLWPLCFWLFWLVPSFIRDAAYDILARNRYKWFGREEACRMPTPELRARFLQ